ncbi:Protein BOP3 [Candida tropicalis]
MSSMSVNSLIDKNSEDEKQQQQQPQVKSIPQKRSSSNDVEELQPPFQGHNTASPSHSTTTTAPTIPSLRRLSESLPHPPSKQEELSRSPRKPINDPGLLALLGPNVTAFPFSEESFQDALKLRAEQERTKQEYYRVETANKNLAILQTALRAQIPINLIPLMCVGKVPELTEEQMKMMLQQPLPQPPIASTQQFQPQVFMQPGLSQEQQIQIIQANQKRMQQELQQQGGVLTQTSPFQKAHRRSASSGGSGSGSISQQDAFNVAGGPPLGFRFGAGSSGNRRPLSPAKIGAAAVANLATPTTPYRGYASASSSARKIPSHHRHSSLPVETPNRQPIIDLNAADPNKGVTSLQSPLVGSTSTIQVKPIPAQPLHKQSKSHVQPSQESMTSFQHVIQFHHWKPTTSQPGLSSSSGSPTRTHSHKRRKSSITSTPIQESSPISPMKSRPDDPIKEPEQEKIDAEQELASSTPKATTSDLASKDDDTVDPDTSMESSISDTTASKVDVEANPPKAHRRNKSTFGSKNP